MIEVCDDEDHDKCLEMGGKHGAGDVTLLSPLLPGGGLANRREEMGTAEGTAYSGSFVMYELSGVVPC